MRPRASNGGRRTDRRALAVKARWGLHAIRAGGALIVVGSVLPWVKIPLAAAYIPVPGVVGWGAMTLVLGAWLARRPAAWTGLLGGAACGIVAWRAFVNLPRAVRTGAIILEGRVQPLNDLLARFSLPPMSVFDFGPTGAALRGPGTATVLSGAGIALAGGALALLAAHGRFSLGQCATCGHRDRFGRLNAFCVACGAPMPAERACPDCHTLAEPGDICCGVCGNHLTGILPEA